MGLDASVRCACLVEDECEHVDGRAITVHLSNWGGYRLFQEALITVGEIHFPTLQRELPSEARGQMPAAAAEAALRELSFFEGLREVARPLCLVDTASGEILRERVSQYDGAFYFGGPGGADVAIGEGFVEVVEHDGLGRTLLRAERLTQVPHAEDDPDLGATWTNEATGQTWASPYVLHRRDRTPVAAMHVERRSHGTERYAYILRPLEAALRASVATGNPVLWE